MFHWWTILFIPHPLDNTKCILNYVASGLKWTLTETGRYCSDQISVQTRNSLVDCQTYCKTTGARRLTFYPSHRNLLNDNNCYCCTESSELLVSTNNGKIYTYHGKYMYLPITNWYRNAYNCAYRKTFNSYWSIVQLKLIASGMNGKLEIALSHVEEESGQTLGH